MTRSRFSRRHALSSFAGLLAASHCLRAQPAPELAGEPPGRIAPLDELANVPEFEPMAARKLNSETYARIAGGERRALERITFRPRMMVNTLQLDLSLKLCGQEMFAPILIGPASRQQHFHSDGERATAQGAQAANTVFVAAERSGASIEETTVHSPAPWYQAYPDADFGALHERVLRAVQAGARAVCLTLGDPGREHALPTSADSAPSGRPASYGWDAIQRLRDVAGAPLLLKGVMQPSEARAAAERGIAGIVVSNHGSGRAAGAAEPVSLLPAIAEEVGGRIPILVDGGFRRGGDVLKALALGASAVLVCRPVLWGLAAYGALGVQKVLEMLQTELARDMVEVGAVNLAAIRRDHVRVHSR